MKKIFLLLLLPLQLFCQQDVAKYVDPFIGTGGHGHTFPGPTLPFGMVQLSPDTRLRGWDGCSGYHFSDNVIYGFSHTHLSGTGCSDYGDVLLMPTVGEVTWNNQQYASSFQKENELATAGYYSVFLDKPGVRAELTATTRTGLHRYTFPKTDAANIILDLNHRDQLNEGLIQISGDNEISGYRISTKWASNQHVYFVIQFSKPFKTFGIAGCKRGKRSKQTKGGRLKAFVQFATEKDEVIHVRVGISPVSVEGARKNLEAEQPEFDFARTKAAAVAMWNAELGKIEIEDEDERKKRIFYTALYHAMIAPNVYQDVDGNYRGRDGKISASNGFTNYTVFSLWDTYRALHPLFTLISRDRNADFIRTFLTQYEQAGLLPIWELAGYETFCMIGYHSIPVITDAYLKGITGFDAQRALEAMKKSAETSQKDLKRYKLKGSIIVDASYFRYAAGFDDYLKYGFIRQRFINNSVSKTLEYAYDDWCIAQMAKALGDSVGYETYIGRAANYRNLFDPETGFMRPRGKHNFKRRFDPYKVTQSYTEANAWQYSFYVPHDISGHMQLLGGKEKLGTFLDTLFTTSSKLKGPIKQDVSGLMGQYAHGNEPSHQIVYQYNYAGQPWKTQARVRKIMDEFYSDKPDGLVGNEDCGQMSAWYIFSALGFYPVCPGSDHYVIGSPIFKKAILHLENGKDFTVQTSGNDENNVYIQSATLNGSNYTKSYLKYADITNGGILELKMGSAPNQNWGSAEGDVPVTEIR